MQELEHRPLSFSPQMTPGLFPGPRCRERFESRNERNTTQVTMLNTIDTLLLEGVCIFLKIRLRGQSHIVVHGDVVIRHSTHSSDRVLHHGAHTTRAIVQISRFTSQIVLIETNSSASQESGVQNSDLNNSYAVLSHKHDLRSLKRKARGTDRISGYQVPPPCTGHKSIHTRVPAYSCTQSNLASKAIA